MVQCKVCGNRSSGVHYGVESCEGCKAFYKRWLVKSVDYKCYFGNKCFDNDEATQRYRCKACRFKRCVELGMDLHARKKGRKIKENDEKAAVRAIVAFQKSTVPAYAAPYFPGRFCEEDITDHTLHSHNSVALIKSGSSVIRHTNAEHYEPMLSIADLKIDENQSRSQVSLGSLVSFRNRTEVDPGALRTTNVSTRPIFLESTLRDKLANVDPPMPKFLSDYWSVIQQRGFLINNTINAVASALNNAYGDLFTLWNGFMREIQIRGTIPPRPDLPLETVIKVVQKGFEGFIKSGCRFQLLLPGFSDLDRSDQALLLLEKFAETWLVCHAPYLRNGEWYILIGPNRDFHCSHYWMSQILEADHYEVLLSFATELNAIQLTHLEHFILHAVATFQPENTTAKNKPLLSFLHSHYMDCLLHSIRARCTREQQIITEKRLSNFMKRFRSLYRLGNFYVRRMSYERIPFIAIKGARVITVEDALTNEDDGLVPIRETMSPLLA